VEDLVMEAVALAEKETVPDSVALAVAVRGIKNENWEDAVAVATVTTVRQT